jgi:hypothetical protein
VTARQMSGPRPVLVALGVAFLAGCGGGSGGAARAAPSIGAAPPGEAAATVAPTIAPDAELLGSTGVPVTKFTDQAGFISFTTPTRSVGCTITVSATTSAAICQPVKFSYAVREPGSCPQGPAWGSIVQLTTTAAWICATDAVGGAKVLDYGARLDSGDFSCVDRPDGVTCQNARTAHGFRISPTFYTFF